jgi:serine protease SohB
MLSWLSQYGLFVLQSLTVVILIVFGIILLINGLQKGEKNTNEGKKLQLVTINNKIDDDVYKIKKHLLKNDAKGLKKLIKSHNKETKKESEDVVFVIDFDGDIKASEVENLRNYITLILSLKEKVSEVVIRLESGGGMVHSYGLASAQIARLRNASIRTTICIDRVAASGGYMMACVAHNIVSAPYAVIGSIGVIMQIPNFNKLLKKHDVEFEQITAGKNKRKLTMFGKNTSEGREKTVDELENIHSLFKNLIKNYRSNIDIDKVANGDTWYGVEAINMGLVDLLQTSDEYLMDLKTNHKLILMSYKKKVSIIDKIFNKASVSVENTVQNIANKFSSPK